MDKILRRKVPVTLITGYLGAGKTTLLNHILKRQSNLKIAVIVNDMGAINIDASLIKSKAYMKQENYELIDLQNGCICCTLRDQFMEQVLELSQKDIDGILVEASGISDPVSIAEAFLAYQNEVNTHTAYLNSILTVVDADRIYNEFLEELNSNIADQLEDSDCDPDIINLIMNQIEFCNVVLLNKCDLLKDEQIVEVKQIIKSIQPEATLIQTKYADVDIDSLLQQKSIDYNKLRDSSSLHKTLYNHNHSIKQNGEIHEEYGISSFVYTRREPFEYERFMNFLQYEYPKTLIRAKGYLWFGKDKTHAHLFEQAGRNASVTEISTWVAALPNKEREEVLKDYPEIMEDWDSIYGDRIIQIVFIGKGYVKEDIITKLEQC